MSPTIQTFVQMRGRIRAFAESISAEDAAKIPTGFNNNIAWNIGHISVTQQLLCYRLSGLPLAVDDAWVEMFGKGSKPADWTDPPEYSSLFAPLTELAAKFETDYREGIFKEFQPYKTSAGIELNTIDEAVTFNNLHEGIHLGYAMALRRAL